MTISVRSWSPLLDVSDIALWLDCADTSTITLNGSNVSNWAGKGTFEYNVYQSTADNQPAYGTNQLNGIDVISFDGNDYLVNDLDNGLFDVLNGLDKLFTVFTVFKFAVSPSTYMIWAWGDYDGNNNYYNINSRASGGSEEYQIAGAGGGVFAMAADTGGTTDTNYHISSYTRGATNLYLDIDGGNVLTTTPVSATWVGVDNFTLGARIRTTPLFYLNGDIAEVIVYSRELSSSERASVETYLLSKWGI